MGPPFRLGPVSIGRLKGVHPDLVRVVSLAIETSPYDFTITEGVRTKDRQIELVKKGVSWTLNSKHLVQSDGFGHAFDIVAVGDLDKDGDADDADKDKTWDRSIYTGIAASMKVAAVELGVRLAWGGDWERKFDGPHYELVTYPTSNIA